ncbi:hypothetical protein BGY98DRAFT_493375 [Russula aff. rugulosa BPL654]|nr:hypothetical protein BGY98DRAFT_493375 [Russula aff. rugulosa BPL654]
MISKLLAFILHRSRIPTALFKSIVQDIDVMLRLEDFLVGSDSRKQFDEVTPEWDITQALSGCFLGFRLRNRYFALVELRSIRRELFLPGPTDIRGLLDNFKLTRVYKLNPSRNRTFWCFSSFTIDLHSSIAS